MGDRHLISVVAAPVGDLLALDAIKSHIRVDIDEDDVVIGGYLGAATAYCEAEARRAFLSQTLRMSFDRWGMDEVKRLKRPPFVEIVAVRVWDRDGDAHIIDAEGYWFDRVSGRVCLNPDYDFPAIEPRPFSAFEIDYVAGYGDDAAAVPEMYKQAVLLLIGHWYENREAALVGQGFMAMPLPYSVKALLSIDRGGFF